MADSRLVYGVGPVRELVRAHAKKIVMIYCTDGREPKQIAADARNRGVHVESASRGRLDQLCGDRARHQGVVAVTGEYEYADVDGMLAVAESRGEPALIVALDGVKDPHNLGAIIRSAYVMGAHGVVVPCDRAAEVTPTVTKVSAGATEHIGVARVTNLARTLGELKEAGVWVAAVASDADSIPPWQLDAVGPLCLVLGTEGTGIRRLVARECDFRVEIPMVGTAVGSLNVSVAAGALLYEVRRQRAARGGS